MRLQEVPFGAPIYAPIMPSVRATAEVPERCIPRTRMGCGAALLATAREARPLSATRGLARRDFAVFAVTDRLAMPKR